MTGMIVRSLSFTRNTDLSTNHRYACSLPVRFGAGHGVTQATGVTRRTTAMTTTTMTGTGTKNEERARRCPRRSLLTHWGVGGGCTRHYPELQSSYKMHFHLSTYLRMRPVSRGLFRSAPNAGRCALFSVDRKLISTLSFAKRKKIHERTISVTHCVSISRSHRPIFVRDTRIRPMMRN